MTLRCFAPRFHSWGSKFRMCAETVATPTGVSGQKSEICPTCRGTCQAWGACVGALPPKCAHSSVRPFELESQRLNAKGLLMTEEKPPRLSINEIDGRARLPKILRPALCRELLGISNGAFYARQNPQSKYYDPDFPRRVRLGMRAVGYALSDLESYIQSKIKVH